MKAVLVRIAGRLKANRQFLLSIAVLVVAGAVSRHIVLQANHSLTYVPKTLAECRKNTAKEYRCYANYYANLAFNKGTDAAFKDMEVAYNNDAYVKAECHQLAHLVGRTAFERTGSLEKAYAEGNSFCWSGFHHGAIEQAITRLGADSVKNNTANICEAFATKARYSFNHFNCVHGLGHGLMAIAGYNLHEGLKLCDNTKTEWEQRSCYGGVFMENVMVAARGDGTSAYLDPARPLYPCTDVVGSSKKEQCYLIQSSYVLQHNGYDFAKTFIECAQADTGFVDICNQSIGRDASGTVDSDIPRTVANCQAAPQGSGRSDALRNCMYGAARDFVGHYHDDKKARQLCAAFGSDLQALCEADVTNYYSTF